MKWHLKAALTGAMLIASASMAQAVPVTFDFTTSGPNTLSPFILTSTEGVSVTVTGHSMNGTGPVTDWNVTRYTTGVGVSSSPNDGGLGGFQVDGYGPDEFLQFVFSENVSILGAEFSYVDSNDDFRWFRDSSNDGTISGTDTISTSIDIPDNSIYNAFTNDVANLKVFGLGVSDTYDNWKLKTLTVEYTTPVPVPAALPLFGTGLAFMGFIGWRRRKKAAAA